LDETCRVLVIDNQVLLLKVGVFYWFLYLLLKQVQLYVLLVIPLKLYKINPMVPMREFEASLEVIEFVQIPETFCKSKQVPSLAS
jgi:hypothetical protein